MAGGVTAKRSYLGKPVSAVADISGNTLDLLQARPEFAGISRGREFTRKTRRLASGLSQVDQLIGGGIARGRIRELTGGTGKTSLAAAFASKAIRDGEVAAWLDLEGCCDPLSLAAAGVNLERVLWTAPTIKASSAEVYVIGEEKWEEQ